MLIFIYFRERAHYSLSSSGDICISWYDICHSPHVVLPLWIVWRKISRPWSGYSFLYIRYVINQSYSNILFTNRIFFSNTTPHGRPIVSIVSCIQYTITRDDTSSAFLKQAGSTTTLCCQYNVYILRSYISIMVSVSLGCSLFLYLTHYGYSQFVNVHLIVFNISEAELNFPFVWSMMFYYIGL